MYLVESTLYLLEGKMYLVEGKPWGWRVKCRAGQVKEVRRKRAATVKLRKLSSDKLWHKRKQQSGTKESYSLAQKQTVIEHL